MLNSTQYAELILEGAKNMDDFYGDPYDDPYSFTTTAKDIMDYYSSNNLHEYNSIDNLNQENTHIIYKGMYGNNYY